MTKKINKRVLEKIKPGTLIEAKMTKLKTYYFRHIMRRKDSSGKTIMMGKIESSRKRGRLSMRWIDTIKEAIF